MPRHPVADLIGSEEAYRAELELLHRGELPSAGLIHRFVAEHGNALSDKEIRNARDALRGTELERAVMADAAKHAAERAQQARAQGAETAVVLARKAQVRAETRPEYDRTAIERFERIGDHARAFRQALEHHGVPFDRQGDCAEYVLGELTDIAERTGSGKVSWRQSVDVDPGDRLKVANIRREVACFAQRGCDLERAREARRRERELDRDEFRRDEVHSVETELTRLRNHLAKAATVANRLGGMFGKNPELADFGDFQWRECAEEFARLGAALRRIVPDRHRIEEAA